MLMFTEQKLLFSWWPVEQNHIISAAVLVYWPGGEKRFFCVVTFFCHVWVSFTRRPAARNLHVELDGVHAEDGVSNVAQHVPTGGDAHKCRKLLQLLKLGLPPEQIWSLLSANIIYIPNVLNSCSQNWTWMSSILGFERVKLIHSSLMFK